MALDLVLALASVLEPALDLVSGQASASEPALDLVSALGSVSEPVSDLVPALGSVSALALDLVSGSASASALDLASGLERVRANSRPRVTRWSAHRRRIPAKPARRRAVVRRCPCDRFDSPQPPGTSAALWIGIAALCSCEKQQRVFRLTYRAISHKSTPWSLPASCSHKGASFDESLDRVGVHGRRRRGV